MSRHGFIINIDPVLPWHWSIRKGSAPAPLESAYRISYQNFDGALLASPDERSLVVPAAFLKAFRKEPWRGKNPNEIPLALNQFLLEAIQTRYIEERFEAHRQQREFIVAVSSNARGIEGLANVPWELTADPRDDSNSGKQWIGLDPAVTFCRLMEEPEASVLLDQNGPLRVFYSISNQPPQFDKYVPDYQRYLQNFGHRHPQIVTLGTISGNLQPSYQETLDTIEAFSPHILIHIGHGQTTNKGEAQLRFEDWYPVQDFAESLAKKAPSLFLVLQISCDATWASALDPHACGPVAWLSAGIPAVITMQAMVSATYAATFLEKLLNYIFTDASLPWCVTKARQTTDDQKSLEWAVPALFISRAAFDVIEPLSQWQERFRHQFSRIASSFPATVNYWPREDLKNMLSQWLDDTTYTGTAVVEGNPGTGRTTLLAKLCRERYEQAARNLKEPPRPLLYLNPEEYGLSSVSQLLDRINDIAKLYALSMSRATGKALELDLAVFLDRHAVVLILDDADHLPHEELKPFFDYFKGHLQRGLVIGIVTPPAYPEDALDPSWKLEVHPLTENETKSYLNAHRPEGDAAEAKRWYEETGGYLGLLSQLSAPDETYEPGPVSAEPPQPDRDLAETSEMGNVTAREYLEQLRPTLSQEAFDLLAEISVFPGSSVPPAPAASCPPPAASRAPYHRRNSSRK